MRLTIDARQPEEVSDLWKQLTESLKQLGKEPAPARATTIADEIGIEGVRRQKKMIELGRRLDTGERFKPLNPVYAARKAKLGGGSQMLVWTRAMSNSIDYEVDGPRITIGPTDEKARYHVSLDPRTKIPLRDFVTLPESFYEWVEELVADGAALVFERRLGGGTRSDLARAA